LGIDPAQDFIGTREASLLQPITIWAPIVLSLALGVLPLAVPSSGIDFTAAEPAEALSGGTATNEKRLGRAAFSEPSTTMRFEKRHAFFLGNGLFHRTWTPSQGLGPRYNATGCHRCHVRDGRGRPPDEMAPASVALVLRLSIPPQDAGQRERLAAHRIASVPEPVYGVQLQTSAIEGARAEGRIAVAYEETPVKLADGHTVTLRSPRYAVDEPALGALHPAVMMSPRIAPPLIGLGLLEAIAAEDIEARADPDDRDGDGISGRARFAFSDVEQRVMLGRFGWKAGRPTIVDQSAAAFALDVGVSSPLYPGIGGVSEVSRESLELVAFYSRQLAVPRRRNVDDSNVLRGKALFHESGCAACHVPMHVTRSDWPLPALADQAIRPYTDVLLHDMGEGLADGRPEGTATGREWRTPPLWGIGLTETVSGHTYFLHDGRARSLLEAILWHGGEALAAREAVRSMDAGDRASLLDFLNSL
jgi:CxxC motif-containing protein (DUF1111 family)